jgi:uncharacterized membrane protein
VTKYDWLLLVHILGAFLVLGGSIVAGVLHLVATRRERPSEIALLLRLIRPMVALVGVGMVLVLAFGLWLVDDAGYRYCDAWVIAALVLLVLSGALGSRGGRKLRHARELAERLAMDGDRASPELHAAVTNRQALILSYASFLALVAILVLMVFKPGA